MFHPMHFESFQNASASPNLPCRLTVAINVVQVVRLGIMNPDDPRIRKDPDGIPHLGCAPVTELKDFLMVSVWFICRYVKSTY